MAKPTKDEWKRAVATVEAIKAEIASERREKIIDAMGDRIAELRDDFGWRFIANEAFEAMERTSAEFDKVAKHDARLIEAEVALDGIVGELGEPFGVCEGCAEPLFDGDLHHGGIDATLCQNCAPSYADMLACHENFRGGDDEPMTEAMAQAVCDAHVAAGGSLNDKVVSL